jgi:hypothetical protein
MTVLSPSLTDSEIRGLCKDRLEALEHWLRRLIDDTLTPTFGDFFEHQDQQGNRLIRKGLSEQIDERRNREPQRYPRKIDAILLEDAVGIVCNPQLYSSHFRKPLLGAFPDGIQEARTFLNRLLSPRNHLAHANPISSRQAEQIICYSNDVIDSLKAFYVEQGLQSEYNAPQFLRVVDSFGRVFTRGQMQAAPGGGAIVGPASDPRFTLRPGDTLTIEVDVDPSFSAESYSLTWNAGHTQSTENTGLKKAVIHIGLKHVSETFIVRCTLMSNQEWHRHGTHDDTIAIFYKVLPPV